MVEKMFSCLLVVFFFGSCEKKESNEEYSPLEFQWEKEIDGFYYPPLLENGIVYVITKEYKAYAIQSSNGEFVWKSTSYGYPSVTSRIISDDSCLYYPVVWGAAASIYKHTGQVKWHTPTQANTNYAKITLDNNTLYVSGFGKKDLMAVNKLNGEILWSFDTRGGIRTTPIVKDDFVYVSVTDIETVPFSEATGRLYCFNKNNGSKIYEVEYGIIGSGGNPDDMVLYDSLIIAASAYKIYGLNRFNGNVEWESSIPIDTVFGSEAIVSPMYLDGHRIYGGTVVGAMVCFDILDRKTVWYKQYKKSTADGRPFVNEELFILQNAGTDIVAVNKHDGSLLWSSLSRVLDPLITNDYIIGQKDFTKIRKYKMP